MQATSDQPTYLSLENYDNIDQIRNKFPPLSKINTDHTFNNLEECRFFIIRTQGEDNVHRAMKYGIWTSTSRKNERLNEAFVNKKQDVYLFFTEINSMCFSGMAKLTSNFDSKAHFKYWLIENKWFGTFKIEWLYVKDLSFKYFEEIKQIQKLEGSEETLKSVYDLIDCTELSTENGIKMVRVFQNEKTNKSLFEEFAQLDKLEFESRNERSNNQRFEKKYKELSAAFEAIPFSFSVAQYERKKVRKPQGGYYQGQQYSQQQYYYQQQYQQYYQQQPFMGYQFQQTPQYWQSNNGFYQNQQYYQQNQQYNKPYQQRQHYQNDRQSDQQQQQNIQQDEQQEQQQQQQQQQNVPLESRFQVKTQQQPKKFHYDKKRKNNNVQYVEKSQTEVPVQNN